MTRWASLIAGALALGSCGPKEPEPSPREVAGRLAGVLQQGFGESSEADAAKDAELTKALLGRWTFREDPRAVLELRPDGTLRQTKIGSLYGGPAGGPEQAKFLVDPDQQREGAWKVRGGGTRLITVWRNPNTTSLVAETLRLEEGRTLYLGNPFEPKRRALVYVRNDRDAPPSPK